MPQAAFTGLPFSFGALRFAAVELTEGIIFRNLVDNLPPDPIPDLPWKVHAATAIFFNPASSLRNRSRYAMPQHCSGAGDDVNMMPCSNYTLPLNPPSI